MPLPVSGLLAGSRGAEVLPSPRSTEAGGESIMRSCKGFGELEPAPVDSPLEGPLADVGGIGLPNLRSAVHRAATTQGLTIETLADETNFYVWKTANSK